MPAKKWTKHQREAFARTISAKRESRVKRSQVLALDAPVQQNEVLVWDGNKPVKYRLENIAMYVRAE